MSKAILARPIREKFLTFSPPSIGEEEIEQVADSLRSGWLTTGPKVTRFERAVAELVRAEAALAVSSCTEAMEVALAALDIGEGDEVITTAMTFVSTAHVIERVRAKPVLVDVDRETLLIDPVRVAEAVTPRTKAILPVHLYGHPVDLDALRSIASAHGLWILEDAAHGLPSTYKGTPIGGDGTLAAFSFYATKNITTGEGGMLVGPAELIDRARLWTLHGMSRNAISRYSEGGDWFYDVVVPGLKCNMTDMAAGLGLSQLDRLPTFQKRRRQIWARYNRAFEDLSAIETPTLRRGIESALHLYVIRLELDRLSIDRDQFIKELRAMNIGASVHFIPVHLHQYYREKYQFKPTDFPVAFTEFQRMISLPLHPGLTDDDVSDVIDAVTEIVRRYRR